MYKQLQMTPQSQAVLPVTTLTEAELISASCTPSKSMFGGHFLKFQTAGGLYQTPRVRVLRVSSWQQPDAEGKTKEYIHVVGAPEFMTWWASFEQKMLVSSVAHWDAWFASEFEAGTSQFVSSLSMPECDDTPSRLVAKLPLAPRAKTGLFDGSGNAVDTAYSELVGCTVAMILRVDGLWFMNGRFGLRYEVMELKSYTAPKTDGAKTNEFAFVPDDDS